MADTIERLYKLTVDGTAAARQLDQIAKATDSVDKRMASAITAVSKFAGVLAAAFSAQQVVGAIQRNIDAMDDLAKAVQKVGIGAEDLQRLRYAADLSGVSAEQLDKAVTSLAVGMSNLARGTDETSKALRAIGAKGGESPVETLKRIADQFAAMPDGVAKTALAVDLFGKKIGPDLIPLLNAGADALQELANEADRFGGVVSQKAIEGAEAFNDNMTRLQRTTAGVTAQLTAGMVPALRTLSESLVDSATAGDGFVSTGEAIGEMLLNLYGFALKAGATLQAFGLVVGAVAAAVADPVRARSIFAMMSDDIDALEAKTNRTLGKLESDFKRFNEAATPKPKPAGTGADPAEAARLAAERAAAALKAQKDAAKALEEQENRRMSAAKILIEIEDAAAKATADLADQTARYRKESEDAVKATNDLIRSLDPAGAAAEDFALKLGQIDELFFSGTISAEQYDRMVAQLSGTFGKFTPPTQVKTAIDLVADGFNEFFTTLSSGAADAEDAFKRMTQSILAQLLRLLAKKAVFAAFGIDIGGPGSTTFAAAPQAFTFPTISSASVGPTAFASSTSAGASIAPLRLGGSGGAGIPQQQAPAMQVTINNNHPGAQVDTRQTPGGLEVIISQVRAALTADVLHGGNDFARANERAWGLSRGSAAAF